MQFQKAHVSIVRSIRHVSLVRDWQRIIVVALIVTGLAFLLAWSAKPLYRAETRILIETRESVFTRPSDAAGEANSPVLDEVGVTSQVEVIGSSDILKQVARELNLAEGTVKRYLSNATHKLETRLGPLAAPPDETVDVLPAAGRVGGR